MHIRGPIDWPVQVGDSDVKYFDLYYIEIDGDRYITGIIGDAEEQPIPLRIESACVFGHIFRGVRCDCGEQFEDALQLMMEEEHGIVVFAFDDDARGHGIDMHFKLYELRQHEGRMDEREIFDDLGLELDARDYGPVVDILEHFSIDAVELITNNPERIEVLSENDIAVATQVPLEPEITEHNEKLLLQEKEWLGYDTSYKTYDEWKEVFARERDERSGDFGFLVTEGHADVVSAAFDSEPPRGDELDALSRADEDAFTTIYANYDVADEIDERADKVVAVEDEQWDALQQTQQPTPTSDD